MRNYNNEEEIKIHVVIPWLNSLGYKKEFMEFEKTIKVNEGRKTKSIFADIVVYSDKKLDTPIIVVDTKSPNEILSKEGRDQVISYARLLPKIAPLAILTNGNITQIYQTLDKTRIKELPKRKDILSDFVSAVLSKNIQDVLRQEATKELFTIDDVSTFKDLLKKCHNIIRNNEGYDPIQAFDELSKILFAKMYEEQFHQSSNRFTLDIYDETLEKLNVNIVQQQFSEIQNIRGFKALFPENTSIKLKDRTIREIVIIFENYDLTLTNFDVKGEAFEFFLGDTFTGGLGEFFTPRNVVEFIVEAISPRIGEKIIDPFCGTGGFLIYAFEKVSEKIKIQDFSEAEKLKWKHVLSDESLYGTDWKARTAQACKMNMIVHGDGNTGVFQHDGFKNIEDYIFEEKFDICYTNPPFGARETDENILSNFYLGSGRNSQNREILAIERCINLVKKGTGIVAIVLPDGILNGDRNSYIREFIHKEAVLLGVIGLNKETFEGYNAGVKTSILFLRRKCNPNDSLPEHVFMSVCTNSGYSPTGIQIPGNQLPDILFDFKNFLKLTETDNYEPFHKYSKIVSLNSISERIDAERYIDYIELPPLLDITKLKEDAISNFEHINSVGINIIESIGEKLFDNTYKDVDFSYHRFSDLFDPISNLKSLIPDKEYYQLGIHGKGRGLFVREVNLGSDIGATRLNLVRKNWLIFSRLFAKNGSFAIVYEEFENGTVSNEFPTFKINCNLFNEEELLEYIVFYLISPQTTNYIIRLTTGSTKESRGRFKEEQLQDLYIPIPRTKKVFDQIIKPIIERRNYLRKINKVINSLDQISTSLHLTLPNLID